MYFKEMMFQHTHYSILINLANNLILKLKRIYVEMGFFQINFSIMLRGAYRLDQRKKFSRANLEEEYVIQKIKEFL